MGTGITTTTNNNAVVVAHSVWMLLQSTAKQDADCSIAAVVHAQQRQQDTAVVIGCASLHVILSHDDADQHQL